DDGCLDAKSVCQVGTQAVDTDEDGCGDTCEPCASSATCDQLAIPADSDGDNCTDTCQCADGSKPEQLTGCCPAAPSCGTEGAAVDTDDDGCVDTCECTDGSQLSANDACTSACPNQGCDTPLPLFAYLADQDQDGCYDLVDACALETQGADASGDGCWDHCVACETQVSCPDGAQAIDTDADNCTDTCQFLCDEACECVDSAGEAVAACAEDGLEAGWECNFGVCQEVCVLADTAAESCPLSCKQSDQCPADHFCDKAIGACESDGLCAPRPLTCVIETPSPEDSAVCGCDGEDYASACHASMASTSVLAQGACQP
ncbi:MAG: hypothetical protein QF464_23575, partial [Myxococcota bacterium]|nr:hypothetical protein [Myxococcota bacterium]